MRTEGRSLRIASRRCLGAARLAAARLADVRLATVRFAAVRLPTGRLAGVRLAVGALVVTCGLGVACGGVATDASGTNLLLISVDTLRADRLGAYGYGAVETPAIDRLADEGVRFARVVTPVPMTLPAHASLFTGNTPLRHGVHDNAAEALGPGAETLAEAFSVAGYDTGAFVGAFVLDPRWGLVQGFDVYDAAPVPAGASPTGLEQAERQADVVVDAALEWLRQRSGRWFAWVHLFDPHLPYRPPPPYDRQYAEHPYDGEVAFVDAMIGRLRAGLEETGQWEETTVVFTADHGEALGEHGEPAHGFFLYEETLRVPLIVRPADTMGDALERGRVVEDLVGLIDVFPTLAQLYGIGAETGKAGVEGRSLMPLLEGEGLEPLPVYSETLLPLYHFGWHDLRAITAGDLKYVRAPREELYDLAADPDERHDLSAERPAEVARLRASLDEALETAAVALAAEMAGTAASPETAAGLAATGGGRLDAATEARLRSLGYLRVAGRTPVDAELADPKDKVATYRDLVAANAAWQEGDLEGALALIDAVLEREPDFAGAHYTRGLALAGHGRSSEAAAAFRRALEIDPAHPMATFELARVERRLGNAGTAAEILESLLAQEPDDIGLRWELGALRLDQGDLKAAARIFDEGVRMAPWAAPLHMGRGLVALQERDLPAARAAFDRAAAIDASLPNLEYHRALVLESMGQAGEAIAAYERQIALQADHYAAHFNRARLMGLEGRTEEMIAGLRRALAARPEAIEARALLARALADRGDAASGPEAIELGRQVLRGTDEPGLRYLAHMTLAQIFEQQGRRQEAAAERAAAAAIRGGR